MCVFIVNLTTLSVIEDYIALSVWVLVGCKSDLISRSEMYVKVDPAFY